jgi:ketosteroid isomerase-like protein
VSHENVELVQQGIDAWNRRDVESLAALAGPGTEVVRVLEAEPLRGPDAIRRWAADSFEAWTVARCSDVDLRDLGDDVCVLGSVHVRGRMSGAVFDSPVGAIASFTEGQFTRLRLFASHDQALKAVGLEE